MTQTASRAADRAVTHQPAAGRIEGFVPHGVDGSAADAALCEILGLGNRLPAVQFVSRDTPVQHPHAHQSSGHQSSGHHSSGHHSPSPPRDYYLTLQSALARSAVTGTPAIERVAAPKMPAEVVQPPEPTESISPPITKQEKVEPVSAEPEPFQPETVEPETVEPETVEPELIEPETVEPETVEPELVEPELAVPDPIDPDPVVLEKPEPTQIAPEQHDKTVATSPDSGDSGDSTLLVAAAPGPALPIAPKAPEGRQSTLGRLLKRIRRPSGGGEAPPQPTPTEPNPPELYQLQLPPRKPSPPEVFHPSTVEPSSAPPAENNPHTNPDRDDHTLPVATASPPKTNAQKGQQQPEPTGTTPKPDYADPFVTWANDRLVDYGRRRRQRENQWRRWTGYYAGLTSATIIVAVIFGWLLPKIHSL